jgi:hypothetical protein
MRKLSEIMAGFPEPGPMPKRKRDESDEAYQARIEEHGWQEMAYRAVHSADPGAGQTFAHYVTARLVWGELPTPAREWLLFVIGSLLQKDELPSLHSGRPSDPRARYQRLVKLARFIVADEKKRPKARKDARLDEAAKVLGQRWVLDTDYKSKTFKELLKAMRAGS